MKIIILGAGEVGFHTAQKLSQEGQDVVLVDHDPEQIKRVADNLDVQVFLGSGTSPRILRDAGIENADLLVAATNSDEVNIIACLLAKNLNRLLFRVARVRNEEYLLDKNLLGDDFIDIDHMINPQSEMVRNIQSLMEIPGASEVIDFAEGRVKLIGFTVVENSPLAGMPMISVGELSQKMLIGAIVRQNQVIIPGGKDTVFAGDMVYVVIRREDLGEIPRLLHLDAGVLRRVIIIGAGQTGISLARLLDHSGITARIIEKDTQKCIQLSEELNHVIVINGDGADRDLLQEENVKDVDFLVALTGDEESNILISLLAKGLGAKKTITRVSKMSYIPLMSAIGIDTVVSPRLSAVRAILQHIRPGKIISVVPLKGERAEAIEAEALETSEIVNTPLSKVKIPKGALVGAILRGEEVIIPRGDSVIKPKDRLVLFALQKVVPKLEKLLTVKLEYF